jgi:hypothetical protein
MYPMKAGGRTTASGFKTELKTSSANGLIKTSFLLSGSYSNEDLIIVNLRTNCTKESFDPVLSIAELPFFKQF